MKIFDFFKNKKIIIWKEPVQFGNFYIDLLNAYNAYTNYNQSLNIRDYSLHFEFNCVDTDLYQIKITKDNYSNSLIRFFEDYIYNLNHHYNIEEFKNLKNIKDVYLINHDLTKHLHSYIDNLFINDTISLWCKNDYQISQINFDQISSNDISVIETIYNTLLDNNLDVKIMNDNITEEFSFIKSYLLKEENHFDVNDETLLNAYNISLTKIKQIMTNIMKDILTEDDYLKKKILIEANEILKGQ